MNTQSPSMPTPLPPTGPSAFCVMRLENTDTFGGEANYAWAKRAEHTVPTTITRRAAVRAAKAWAGYTGLRCDVEDLGDEIHIRPRGICQVLFVDFDYSFRPLSRREAALPGRGWARRWGFPPTTLTTQCPHCNWVFWSPERGTGEIFPCSCCGENIDTNNPPTNPSPTP